MPAPDFPTLYDFESQIEAAVKSALISGGITNVYTTRDNSILLVPRVEAQLNLMGPTGHMAGLNGRETPDQFEAILRLAVVTSRSQTETNHAYFRGNVRYQMASIAQQFNSTSLPYLQIMQMLPAQSTPQIFDDKEHDITELKYHVWFGIQATAWPIS